MRIFCPDQSHMAMIQKNPPPYQGGARGGRKHTVGNRNALMPVRMD